MSNFDSSLPKEWKASCDTVGGQILDVRTDAEFEESFIDGAIQVDFMGQNFASEIEKLDKNKADFIYCRSGVRSRKAMAIMESTGFKEVHNLDGGIMQWEQKGMEVNYGD